MRDLHIDTTGRLLIRKDLMIYNNVYSEVSYRKQKSIGRFDEIHVDGDRWVLFDSLPPVTRKKVVNVFSLLSSEHRQLLEMAEAEGGNAVGAAIEVTAQTLNVNEPFIRSAIDTYVNTHYMLHTELYLNYNMPSASVKNYAKQCALVQWIGAFAEKIKAGSKSDKQKELLMRSFRMNLLTALRSMGEDIKIPMSEARFNAWFDNVITKTEQKLSPSEIIQPKRAGNGNSQRITQEQIDIAVYWYINGINMPVRAVYAKWVAYGKQQGWWMVEDTYKPPTEARLYQLLKPYRNAATLEKTDQVNYRLKMMPTVTRSLPKMKNHVWVIDGTAHNENVKNGGKVRQHIYAIKIMDVATMRIVGVAPLIGVKEPFTALEEAILMGIRVTGYKPAIIQTDHGPAWRELEAWCGDNDIKLYPSIVGNARAKTIESMFNMFDNDITRFMPGYSGQNRTARSLNSRSSDKRETAGKRSAKDAKTAMNWLKTDGVRLWNERIIETLEGKPCGKTPMELWDEKESYVPQLSYRDVCLMTGTLHQRKLTIEGLKIEHNRHSYTYFPPIDTPEQRKLAATIFTHTPIDARTSNVMSIYVLEGGEPAAVYNRDGLFLGIWTVKESVPYIAETDEDNDKLNKMMALQYRVKEQAEQINEKVKKSVAMHPDFENIESTGKEMLTAKHRAYTGRYDKSELLMEEADEKAGEQLEQAARYKELVDPDTGEIITIKIS